MNDLKIICKWKFVEFEEEILNIRSILQSISNQKISLEFAVRLISFLRQFINYSLLMVSGDLWTKYKVSKNIDLFRKDLAPHWYIVKFLQTIRAWTHNSLKSPCFSSKILELSLLFCVEFHEKLPSNSSSIGRDRSVARMASWQTLKLVPVFSTSLHRCITMTSIVLHPSRRNIYIYIHILTDNPNANS